MRTSGRLLIKPKRGLLREDGSFTLEASMVFPYVLIVLIVMIFFSMYVYQKVIVYHAALQTAERAAFRWDNSGRDPQTGIGVAGRYDGLYWRMSGNGALQALFGFGGTDGRGRYFVDIGSGPGGGGSASPSAGMAAASGASGRAGDAAATNGGAPALPQSLIGRKLSSSARIPEFLSGRLEYNYGVLEKRITAELREPMSIPLLEQMLGHSEPAAVSSALIVDPVEFIRNVDLVRYYIQKFRERPDFASARGQGAQALRQKGAAAGG